MNKADIFGFYSDFSGTIKYKETDCEVKNATFELLETEKRFKNIKDIHLEFHRGDVISGNLCYAYIKHCNFYGDTIYSSVFRNGTFNGKDFTISYWYDGVWQNGIWGLSFDKFGRCRLYPPSEWNKLKLNVDNGLIFNPGIYQSFTGRVKVDNNDFIVHNADVEITDKSNTNSVINGGEITEGNIYNFDIFDCIITCDKLMDSRVRGCTFNGGTVAKCRYYDNIWNNGVWENGVWLGGGTWVDGEWHGGIWRGGYDKNGVYHRIYDSPDKWDL